MLDTGVDVPECLNLVFFKKVLSKAKFFQMIGRGTRLCPKLIDGKDKTEFYIFDFCDNFVFFRAGKDSKAVLQESLQSALFFLKLELIRHLQDSKYQTKELIKYRNKLIDESIAKVRQLNKNNFAVKQHIAYVDKFANKENMSAYLMRIQLLLIMNWVH